MSHKFIFCAISLPKIIKVGGNLTKLWQKQFCTVFLRHGLLQTRIPLETQLVLKHCQLFLYIACVHYKNTLFTFHFVQTICAMPYFCTV